MKIFQRIKFLIIELKIKLLLSKYDKSFLKTLYRDK